METKYLARKNTTAAATRTRRAVMMIGQILVLACSSG